MIPARVKARSFSSDHVEAWEAASPDGAWLFERLELPGTPWSVTHRDFPGWSALFPTLIKARRVAEEQLHLDLTVNLPARLAEGHPLAGVCEHCHVGMGNHDATCPTRREAYLWRKHAELPGLCGLQARLHREGTRDFSIDQPRTKETA